MQLTLDDVMSDTSSDLVQSFRKESERFLSQAQISLKFMMLFVLIFLISLAASFFSNVNLLPLLIGLGVIVIVNYIHYHLTMMQANHYDSMAEIVSNLHGDKF